MILQPEQIEQMAELMAHHNEVDKQPSFSKRKVKFMLEQHIDDPKALLLTNKEVTAVLILMVVPSLFSTMPNLTMVEFYSKTAGSGIRLLKEAQPWIDSWGNSIMHQVFPVTSGKASEKLMERLGMTKMGTLYNMRGEG